MKCDGTRAGTRYRLSAKRTSPFKSAVVASVQSTAGSRGVRISGSNAGYTMFRGSAKSTGYPLHSPVSPSLPSRASPFAITFHLDSTTGITTGLLQAVIERRSFGVSRYLLAKFFLLQIIPVTYSGIKFGNHILVHIQERQILCSAWKCVPEVALHGISIMH